MESIIKRHINKYPLMNQSDIYKLIYQGEFGSGHLITDVSKAMARFLNEIEDVDINQYQDLYEEISNDFVRVNLAPYKKHKLDAFVLFDAFLASSNQLGSETNFLDKLSKFGIEPTNKGSVHHSSVYNDSYHPHYRIIKKSYLTDQMKYVQCVNYLSNIKGGKIIALEGKCGSGKTTLSNKLLKDLPITIINVDDFFLPKEKKTQARLNEIGGNINYESIYNMLSNYKFKNIKKYNKYNCSNEKYEEITFIENDIIILEGVYSYHKYFRHFIDYLIFLDVDNFTQNERLKSRTNYSRFIDEWIPLENRYFESNNIKYLADIII